MDRSLDHGFAMTMTRRKSIVTMTEEQLLTIDPNLTSTDMFPSTFTKKDSSPRMPSTNKDLNWVAGTAQENGRSHDAKIVLPEPKYLSGVNLVIVVTCVIVVAWLMFLDSSIVVTAIPAITDEFHSLQDIGWYGSAYHVANAAFQPLTGKIYRYFSSKPGP
ncbi:MFS multidrug transporter [Colletotrichum tofieldiae]|nr:MFS multidrug transporter [Colletotrichum tofieldiae]GKT82244.1 MFS multidrug transporter [Colletotrichum tofieldiae]